MINKELKEEFEDRINGTNEYEHQFSNGNDVYFSMKKVFFTHQEFVIYGLDGRKTVITEINKENEESNEMLLKEIENYFNEFNTDVEEFFYNDCIGNP